MQQYCMEPKVLISSHQSVIRSLQPTLQIDSRLPAGVVHHDLSNKGYLVTVPDPAKVALNNNLLPQTSVSAGHALNT